MLFSDLFSLINKIQDVCLRTNYIKLYAELHKFLTSMQAFRKTNPPNPTNITNTKNGIENARLQLLSSLNEIQKSISLEEISIYRKSGLEDIFGDSSIELLYRIQNENAQNIDTLVAETTRTLSKLNQFSQLALSLGPVLGKLAIESENEKVDELIIIFEGGALIQNLKDLPKVSKEWGQIVNSFSRLTKDNNTDMRIVSMKSGSLIATFTLSGVIIFSIIRGADKILDLIIKFVDLKKKILEFKSLKLSMLENEINSMEKKAKMNLAEESKNISVELLQEYNWQESDPSYHEVLKTLNQSIKKLIKFHNSGGKVDSNILAQDDAQKVKLIEFKEKSFKIQAIEKENRKLSDAKHILELEDGKRTEDDDSEIDDDKHEEIDNAD